MIREQFRTHLLNWGQDNIRSFPWREPDRTLYEVFVAEFFLTQTPAHNVATVYPRFLSQFPSLDAIRSATESELVEIIRPLGFYNMRASALKQIAETNDTLPDTPSELEKLPRVGEYVANATVCFTYDTPLPVLDRNVNRVYSRVFGDEWPDGHSDQLRFTADLVPDAARLYNFALLDFGATVCTPDPRCNRCFANSYCAFYRDHSLTES
ncbi:hypothetical protein U3A55_13165 [Salarchaeum sp. III]|uniref:hypothetical protein n=1 Tax=Salarchaeum sp. III TaxID=3107927 RepID=UPI002EDAF037